MTIRKVHVTGAGGQVGEGLVPRLAEQFDVVASDQTLPTFETVKTTEVDIGDPSALRAAFSQSDAVVHLAGESSVDADWERVVELNMSGTKRILEAAVEADVDTVVLASSNHAVGLWEETVGEALYAKNGDISIHPREDEVRPDSYYGVSKIAVEALGRYFAETTSLSVICLRIGNVIENDMIPDTDRDAGMWLSNDDAAQLVEKSIISDVDFEVFFGVSENDRRFYSLENANRRIGYTPQDNGTQRRNTLHEE